MARPMAILGHVILIKNIELLVRPIVGWMQIIVGEILVVRRVALGITGVSHTGINNADHNVTVTFLCIPCILGVNLHHTPEVGRIVGIVGDILQVANPVIFDVLNSVRVVLLNTLHNLLRA